MRKKKKSRAAVLPAAGRGSPAVSDGHHRTAGVESRRKTVPKVVTLHRQRNHPASASAVCFCPRLLHPGRVHGCVHGRDRQKVFETARLASGRSRSRQSGCTHFLRGQRSNGVGKLPIARGSAAHLTAVALAPTCSHGAARTRFQFLAPCHIKRGRRSP